ncbi:hypothetical protein ACEPAI_5233 [Sanghuangporus weigelae]
MRLSGPECRREIFRSNRALVKGLDTGISLFRFTRLWVCLTEDELLFFKDSTSALSKPSASIPYHDIKSYFPDTLKANCLRITCNSRTVHICFKSEQELKLWTGEIEACLKPVVIIGENAPNESCAQVNESFPAPHSPPSPQHEKCPRRDSALSGPTLYTTSVRTRRFSSWSASTAYDLDEEDWPELSEFKIDEEEKLGVIEEMDEDQPERPSSPIDPELVFELGRVHLSVSAYPIPRELDLGIADLTGQISKLGDHAIAMGGFSDVWRGIWDDNGRSETVAIKVIRSFCCNDKTEAKVRKRLNQELNIWKKLRHVHIIPLYGVVLEMGRYPSMISPWMQNGNASKFFDGQDVKRTLARRLKLLYEVVSGLEYLHCFSPPIIHGDIKASNILVSDSGHALLTDFGISTLIEETTGTELTASTFAGSVRWMAFELFGGYCEAKGDEIHSPVQLSTYSDIWSFGSTILEVISGKLPYYYRTKDVQVLHEILRGLKPLRAAYPGISPEMWTFLQTCWRDDPKSRPSVTQVKEMVGHFFRERQRMGIIFEDNDL